MTFPLKIVGILKGATGIPRAGLMGEYLFTGNIDDTSDKGNNGVLNAGTYVNDRHSKANSALDLSGAADNYATITSPDMNLDANDFSISLWVYRRAAGSASLFGNSFGDGYAAWQFPQPGLFVNGVTGADLIIGLTDYPLNTWAHTVFTYQNLTKEVKIYLDNTLDVTGNVNTNLDDGTNLFYIGVDSRDGIGSNFNGVLDDLRVYNRILTLDEIEILFNE